jgi:hypothetical protein
VIVTSRVKDLENDFTQGRDNYPKTLVDAYNLLVHWKQDPRNLMRVLGTSNDGVAFTNVGDDEEENTSGRQIPDKARITCWKCKKKGPEQDREPDRVKSPPRRC